MNRAGRICEVMHRYRIAVLTFAVSLLTERYKLTAAGIGVATVCDMYWLFEGNARYELFFGIYEWHEIVAMLCYPLANVFMILLLVPRLSSTYTLPRGMEKLWFLPGAILSIGHLVILSRFDHEFFYVVLNKIIVVSHLLFISGFFFAGYGLCKRSFAP